MPPNDTAKIRRLREELEAERADREAISERLAGSEAKLEALRSAVATYFGNENPLRSHEWSAKASARSEILRLIRPWLLAKADNAASAILGGS